MDHYHAPSTSTQATRNKWEKFKTLKRGDQCSEMPRKQQPALSVEDKGCCIRRMLRRCWGAARQGMEGSLQAPFPCKTCFEVRQALVPKVKDWMYLREVVLRIVPFNPPLKWKIRDKMKANRILAGRRSKLLRENHNCSFLRGLWKPGFREVWD